MCAMRGHRGNAPLQRAVTRSITTLTGVKKWGCFLSAKRLRSMTIGTETVSFDDIVEAMAHIQRRKLLLALLEHNPQDDEPVIIADSDSEADAVGRLISMNHVHLPKLVEYEFIEWDKETHEVIKGPQFDEIRPLLELLDDNEDELPDDWI